MSEKRKAQPAKEHNYVRKLRYMMQAGAIPTTVGLHEVDILHDDWCGIYQQKRCHCNPDIQVRRTS